MAGFAILFNTVLAAAALLTRLTITWSRHVAQIERTLQTREVAELPLLQATGELELDRIVTALNEAGRRVVEARQRADRLARQVAAGERLTAIGRVAAGVAHEIRNPIAAMRLRAENALAGDPERKRQALATILEQIERLDGLLRRLLRVTERDEPRPRCVTLGPFLDACIASNGDLAAPTEIRFERAGEEGEGYFDPEQMRGALDNLMCNAIHAAPAGSRILVAARRDDGNLVLSVHDQGEGPPPEIRDQTIGDSVDWPDEDLPTALARLEEMLIRRALLRSGGNRAEAARMLSIHRQLLYSKIRRYGLEVSDDKTGGVGDADA